MDLSTATPAEIDTQLAALTHAEFVLEGKERAAMAGLHRALGERVEVTGRGASRRESWPTTDAEALAAMRAKGAELIGMMRTAASIVTTYDEAATALAGARDAMRPLDAEYARRGGWTRFFEVAGGHIHRAQNCPTLHRGKERTQLGWLIEMSGTDEAEAIAELAAGAHILCSVCIPGAPVVSAPPAPRKTAEQKAADKATAERKARTEEPKLIADTDGEPLRVDGATLRTVRSAEIAAVDDLWWAAYGRHVGNPNEPYALEHEAHTRKIVAALAFKNGTTPAAELARITDKAIKKIRKDLGAEVATAAAADWAQQSDAAEPAPLAEGQGDTAVAAGAADLDATATARSLPFTGFTSAHAVRMQLADIGQVIRELGNDQVAELGRRLAAATPAGGPAGTSSVPFLAARLITRAGECRHTGDADPACEAHPGFPTADAALGALVWALEAQRRRDEADDAFAVERFLARTGVVAGAEAACRRCGCTENRACPGGCAWASDTAIRAAGLEPMDGDLCTACLPGGDEAQLAACAAEDQGDGDQVAEVLAIADAAPTVTITDPAGLLALVREYAEATARAALRRAGREAETVWCEAHEGAHFDRPGCVWPCYTDAWTRAAMNQADADPAGTLAQIARALGVEQDGPAASVPAPRDGDAPLAR